MENRVLYKNKNWIFPIMLLSIMSIFSQLNPFFDVLITLAFLIISYKFRNDDRFVLIYGVLFVFMPRLYLYKGGLSLISVFLLIYVARMFLKKEKIFLKRSNIVILIFLFIYGIITILPEIKNINLVVNYLITIVFLMSLIEKLTNIEILKKFLLTISMSSLAACIYGIVNVNSYSFTQDVATEILINNRFKGVNSDPNYMAMTLIIGLMGLILINKRYKLLKITLISVFIYFILTTQSTTALLVLLVILAIYLIMEKNQNKHILVLLISLFILMLIISEWNQIYSYLLNSSSFSFFSNRVTEQINDIVQGNNDKIASGRLLIAEGYWNYYWNQNILNILFGGNLCGNLGMGDFVLTFFPYKFATHNTQLDILMSVGLFGWIFFSSVAVKSLLYTWKIYYKTNEIVYKIVFIIKSAIIIFSFSLSFFPSWTLLLFYLLDFRNGKNMEVSK